MINAIEEKKFQLSDLPWLKEDYQHLITWYESERPPSALLITGEAGLGQSVLGGALAKVLLCFRKNEGWPCGACQSCRWYDSYHPDLKIINAENKEIVVATIRELSLFARLTPETSKKIVVIHNAEQMNLNAANSLLKILEEPPADLYFILITHQPSRLPITIVSRCQRYNIILKNKEVAENWLLDQIDTLSAQDTKALLGFAFGAPLTAYRYYINGFFRQSTEIEELFCRVLGDFSFIDKAIPALLAHDSLFFDVMLFSLCNVMQDNVKKPRNRQILSLLEGYSRQFLLARYDELLKIRHLYENPTRNDWVLYVWFLEFKNN